MAIHTLKANEVLRSPVVAGDYVMLFGVWDEPLIIAGLEGTNDQRIRFMPAPGEVVQVPSIQIRASCRHVDVDGFNQLHVLDNQAPSGRQLVLIDGVFCQVNNTLVSSDLEFGETRFPVSKPTEHTLKGLPDGVWVRGAHSSVRDCTLFSLHYGIQLMGKGSYAISNHITEITGDHIRPIADYAGVYRNVLTRSYNINPAEHNDFIQGWLKSKLTPQQGVLTGIEIVGNICVNDSTSHPFSAKCQGIGVFDGVLVDSVIKDNVIITDHDLGIAISRPDNCAISNNLLASPNASAKPRIHLGTTKPNQSGWCGPSAQSRVKGNHAQGFYVSLDCATLEENTELSQLAALAHSSAITEMGYA